MLYFTQKVVNEKNFPTKVYLSSEGRVELVRNVIENQINANNI